jgi:mevalonate kinase
MSEQYYYGHGKLLLTGEYVVMDGAKAVALPTHMGQSLAVKYRPSNNPMLYWKSIDHQGEVWFEATFEPWHFECLTGKGPECRFLTEILNEVRKQNIHFLRDDHDVMVETRLEFNLEWGLGSSSTLLYNIAQWAYVSPFDLARKTMGGSGYDIAAAQSMGPITYQLINKNPNWESYDFNPWFKDKLFFVYTGKKMNTRDAIATYKALEIPGKKEAVKSISDISNNIVASVNLAEFEEHIHEHENIMSSVLGIQRIQHQQFADFDGAIKSLGAWGGDFLIASSSQGEEYVKSYFSSCGLDSVYKYDELILSAPPQLSTQIQPPTDRLDNNLCQ